MTQKIIQKSIARGEVERIATEGFADFVKAVVDVERGIMALGGELHADMEAMLIEQGSRQEDLWGINIYPDKTGGEEIVFNSMINIRPSQGNRSRNIERADIRAMIKVIVDALIK